MYPDIRERMFSESCSPYINLPSQPFVHCLMSSFYQKILKQISTPENLTSSDQQLDSIFTDNLVFIFRQHLHTSTSIPKRITEQELFVDKTQSEYSKICLCSLLMAHHMDTFFLQSISVLLPKSLSITGLPQYLPWLQSFLLLAES